MFRNISNFVGYRQAEWVMVVTMLGLSAQIYVWPTTLSATAFKYLVSPYTNQWIGVFYFLIAYSRGWALVINGRSKYWGPRTRALGAVFGAIIWAQMGLALLRTFLDHPEAPPSTGIPVYLVFTLSELFTAYRAMTDVRKRD